MKMFWQLYHKLKLNVNRQSPLSPFIINDEILTHLFIRIIHQLITKEKQYIQDLDTIESLFVKPLRTAKPPILPEGELEEFVDDVFGNILDLRECNRRLLEVLYVRQREQGPIIQRIGDIFLDAAVEFRLAYPACIGHHMTAEKRLNEEKEKNGNFRFFLEVRFTTVQLNCYLDVHGSRSAPRK